MRRLIYGVATSLDGFIAGPNGEVDWILPDAGIDFAALHSQFDTLLMGRRTWEVARTRGDVLKGMGKRIVVVSTTLNPAQHPGIIVVQSNLAEAARSLKAEPGKDLWLMGGGVLFRSLLDSGLVDALQVSVFPVLLGAGTPLMPEGQRANLKLTESKALPSGVLMLSYTVAEPRLGE